MKTEGTDLGENLRHLFPLKAKKSRTLARAVLMSTVVIFGAADSYDVCASTVFFYNDNACHFQKKELLQRIIMV